MQEELERNEQMIEEQTKLIQILREDKEYY